MTTTDTKIPTTTSTRLLSKPEVLDRVCVTYQTIWAWMRSGKFPRSRVIGGKICWLENEIEAWMTALPKSRLKGDDEAARIRQCQRPDDARGNAKSAHDRDNRNPAHRAHAGGAQD